MKKGFPFWNVVMVLTVIVSLMAFLAHYKNWTKVEQDKLKILSGFYYKKISYAQLDSVLWIDKIPPMERLNGFSAWEKEKGIFREFKDSLTDKKVNVYVDNLSNRKIKLVYNDSLKLYINYADSLETVQLFNLLKQRIDSAQ
ncbi:hypothetical protein [Maribacter polysiphoniae]|uniref:Uncharacterized protein n=2 Tax=Maribacter polysiphoniae TaxID=429344 RepID=A0A316E4G7_9FLAO|nr:hypothetical protein [Maribacter polysiphoniae]PWK25291.1 hypothetical protein LX92_00030 [Maribacter polysiphoniae]